MLTTKRYEYMPLQHIRIHSLILNHRPLNERKVAHYEKDILMNGLLEPLVVWERERGEYYLVGGFHRLAAIYAIRASHPGYFDFVDVRVVAGELDEMRALNLKLNTDRLGTRISEHFQTVMYLKHTGWEREDIARFFDKSTRWVDEILRFVPEMDFRLKSLLEQGKISWTKAKKVCRKILTALPEERTQVADKLIEELVKTQASKKPRQRVLSRKKAMKYFSEKKGGLRYAVGPKDLLSLLAVLDGKEHAAADVKRIQRAFPGLTD